MAVLRRRLFWNDDYIFQRYHDGILAAMSYLWLNDKEINEFVCNDGLIILFDDRLWYYSERYKGWTLRNELLISDGIGFGNAMYTVGAKQCLWLQEGYNTTAIEERINGTINYLINRWDVQVENRYNISAPLLNTTEFDAGYGSAIMDTFTMLMGMTYIMIH